MSFLDLEAISGPIGKLAAEFKRVGMTVKYGTNYDIKAKMEGNGTTYGNRRGALFSNIATMLGFVAVERVDDISVFDGYNSIMLGKDGSPDPNLCVAAFEKCYTTDKKTSINHTHILMNQCRDNVVTILYNMIRMFVIKSALEQADLVISPDDTIYDDGHVRIDAKNFLGIENEKKLSQFDIKCSVDVSVYTEIGAGLTIAPENITFFEASQFSQSDMAVLRLACSDWEDQGLPFKIAHPVFQACNDLIVRHDLDAYRYGNDMGGFTWKKLKSAHIKAAIMRFVVNNRVQAQFDMAYGLVAQVLYSHMPRSAEAFVWYLKRNVMRLSGSQTMRGLHPIITGGTPLVTDTTRWQTYLTWIKSPLRIVLHSIALSEAVHCSTFDYITRDDPENDDPLRVIANNRFVSELGYVRELALVNMRFGYDMHAPWISDVGMRRYDWFEHERVQKLMYVHVNDPNAIAAYQLVTKTGDGPDKHYMRLDTIVPACYPILSMGIRASKYYLNEHHLDVRLKAVPGTSKMRVYSAYDAHKFMAMTRVMGLNSTVRRSEGSRFYTNWAPNSNGHYIPSFAMTEQLDEYFEFDLDEVTKRHHNWIDLPSVTEDLKFSIDMEFMTFQLNIDANRIIVTGKKMELVPFKPELAEVSMLKPSIVYTQAEVKGINAIEKMQDFRQMWEAEATVADSEVFTGPTHIPPSSQMML
jgi:hypothetical protein